MVRDKLVRVDINGREHLKTHVLFWNEQNQTYYCMSPEVLLGPQNEKIKNLTEEMERTRVCVEKSVEDLKNFYEKRCENLETQFKEQLQKTQEINEKLIAMVEEFIKGGEK
jgi:hypothetical protein